MKRVGSWQLAVGSGQLAVEENSWQWARKRSAEC